MTTPLTLAETIVEKVVVVLSLISLIGTIYPETMAYASVIPAPEQPSLIFEIEQTEKNRISNEKSLTFDEIIQQDPLVTGVRNYLKERRSPLAPFADKIVLLPQWQRALAITFVESNFCRFAANNNCGSYGVGPSHVLWRKYTTPFDGFKDLTALLEKPIYKEKYTNCVTMKGVFVVPGSARWVNGCNTVSEELLIITAAAEQERVALALQYGVPHIASAATVEIALVN